MDYREKPHHKSELATYMEKEIEKDVASPNNLRKLFYNDLCSLIESVTTTIVNEMVYMLVAADCSVVISGNETCDIVSVTTVLSSRR